VKVPTPSAPHGGNGRRRTPLPAHGGRTHALDPRTSGRMLRYASVSMLCAAAAAVIVLA
jgi:hypothetical protein